MKKALLFSLFLSMVTLTTSQANEINKDQPQLNTQSEIKTAVFAGGCFWCIEADFEKLNGVQKVVSGYTGGAKETADYKTVSYTETGHYEAVEVSYHPSQVSYTELVEYFWRHIDPTNPVGQFCDSGSSYLSAIFYGNAEEKAIVEASLANLQQNKPFDGEIVTVIAELKPFYLAEEYHQDYYKKNPLRYHFYRTNCGRDRRIAELWGKQ